jgi:hypothetical protein
MRRAAIAVLWGVLLAPGCNKNEDSGLYVGGGLNADARLTSDTYTWDCTDGSGTVDYMGVFGFDIAVEFVPDGLPPRSLPPVGSCSAGLSMFAVDALASGSAIPAAAETPGWATDGDDGVMEQILDGLYFTDVFKNVLSCQSVAGVIGSGVRLVDAGVLDGVTSPTAGSLDLVTASGNYSGGIAFGEDVDLSWEASGWEDSFVQIRRVRNDVAYETVTCNTTGEDSFALDSDVWSLFDEDLSVDVNFLYVGFANSGEVETDYGQLVEVQTRALHVIGINEL